jgi:hypothetical protein
VNVNEDCQSDARPTTDDLAALQTQKRFHEEQKSFHDSEVKRVRDEIRSCAWRLKMCGVRLADIGEVLGVTGERARQLAAGSREARHSVVTLRKRHEVEREKERTKANEELIRAVWNDVSALDGAHVTEIQEVWDRLDHYQLARELSDVELWGLLRAVGRPLRVSNVPGIERGVPVER